MLQCSEDEADAAAVAAPYDHATWQFFWELGPEMIEVCMHVYNPYGSSRTFLGSGTGL